MSDNLKEEEDKANGNEHEELEQGITKYVDNTTEAIWGYLLQSLGLDY